MAPLRGVAIRGISAAVPANIARTADYTVLSEAEREKFAAGTGIAQRHIVLGNQCSSDLCIAAAEDLLARLGWDKQSVQALVMVTQTGDHPVPARLHRREPGEPLGQRGNLDPRAPATRPVVSAHASPPR